MRMWLMVAVAATPGMARAADLQKPQIAPAPAWVVPAPLPPLDGKATEAPIAVLLRDQQLRLSADGDQIYSETLARVQTPEGLNAMGTVALPWKPDNGPLIFHKLRILRGGKEIDLLKDGSAITVIRRENNLELAMLDGVLTAVVQIEGLQIGDVLDMATTMTTRDPVLAGHSEGILNAATPVPIGQLRLRALWDGRAPIRWRAAEATPPAKESRRDGQNLFEIRADNIQPTLLPKGAPPRFAQVGFTEFTGFRSWAELSAHFAPLYAKAETLKPDSPLKAEIARIAAASTDPLKRAEAALALVQNQTRYFALALGDGGLRPAEADLTWERRFADCKGKTVLLLALLHGLGIQAEPAIVSTQLGDGLDQHLPLAGLFDHIIVRATIGGKTYWLDGTRIGDERLADIEVPPFHWALPVRAAGGALEPLVVPPADRPTAVYRYTLDLTAGVLRPAPFHVEEVTRGDEARGLKLGLAALTPEARDRRLRDYMSGRYDDFTITTVSVRFADATGEATLVADGTLAHDFAKFRYDPANSELGFDADFERKDGIRKDAPYAVAYPRYVTTEQTILLPNKGVGFTTGGGDVAVTIAGVEYKRKSTLAGGTYHITTSERAIAPEFPASEAAAAQTALRALKKDEAWIATTAAYQLTREDEDAFLTQAPKTEADYLQRVVVRAKRADLTGAVADLQAAAAAYPESPPILATFALALMQAGKGDAALEAANKALAIDPQFGQAHLARAQIAVARFRFADALPDLDAVLKRTPDDRQALAMRATVLGSLNQMERARADATRLEALGGGSAANAFAPSSDLTPAQRAGLDATIAADPANLGARVARAELEAREGKSQAVLDDTAEAIRAQPTLVDLALLRANAHVRLGHNDKAAAEMDALIKAAPDNDYAHVVAGATFVRLGDRKRADAEFERAIALKPTVYAYLTRASNRLPDDVAGKQADLAAVLKLEPDNAEALALKIGLTKDPAGIAALLPSVEQAIKASPDQDGLRIARGIAYARLGRMAEADADFTAGRALAGGNPAKLNNLCWMKATQGIALESALADCDAAIRIRSDAATLDSRGFVLLRLGRFADAIAAYDAAIKQRPKQAESLFGRGIAELRAKRTAEGEADLKAAKAIDPTVESRFDGYGVTVKQAASDTTG